jgi:hypothetical protein
MRRLGIAMIALMLLGTAATAQSPAGEAGAPSFDDRFVCPESLPDRAAREKQVKDFLEWATEAYPQSTVKEVLEMRLHMLEAHHCTQTLENIRRNN